MTKKNGFGMVLFALVGMLMGTAQATTYTWTNMTLGARSWTDTANWDGAAQFVSGSGNNELRFFANTTTRQPMGTQTISNVPGTLSMNTLTLNGAAPNSPTGHKVIIGEATDIWTIGDGTTSVINLNAAYWSFDAHCLYYTLPNIELNNAITTITGNGAGIGFNFTGNITESVAGCGITKSGSSYLILSGTNSYTGPTTVSGGLLRLNTPTALPGGDRCFGRHQRTDSQRWCGGVDVC